jgi:nucleoside-diphosphate-sugar epimerase
VTDGRLKRLLYSSGTWVHGDTGGETITEETPRNPLPFVKWRAAHEEVALDYAEDGLETIIMRPTIVYGGSRGIFGGWWKEATEQKTVTYFGDGSQRWSIVHVADVAEAYVLALEHANPGDAFVLTDGAEHTVKQLAEAVAEVTGAEARAWPREQVLERLGGYGEALLTNLAVSSTKARRDLGWVPAHTSFLKEAADLHDEWQTGLKEAVN